MRRSGDEVPPTVTFLLSRRTWWWVPPGLSPGGGLFSSPKMCSVPYLSKLTRAGGQNSWMSSTKNHSPSICLSTSELGCRVGA